MIMKQLLMFGYECSRKSNSSSSSKCRMQNPGYRVQVAGRRVQLKRWAGGGARAPGEGGAYRWAPMSMVDSCGPPMSATEYRNDRRPRPSCRRAPRKLHFATHSSALVIHFIVKMQL